MSKFEGDKISLEIWGESHSADIGVIAEGFSGEDFDEKSVQAFCDRRRASNSSFSTKRLEADKIVPMSYIKNGKIVGIFKAKIDNLNKRSGDYDELQNIPRPSHADYPAYMKCGEEYDFRGGGHFSGRMTAPMCIVGGIAKDAIKKKGVEVFAYISSIGNVNGGSYKFESVTKEKLEKLDLSFPILNSSAKALMMSEIEDAKASLDSVGGVIECVITGVPVGACDYMWSSLEGKLSNLLFGIPAVKGVEFGDGFDISTKRASEVNDEMYFDENKNVKFFSNHNGGILGGIATGEFITFRVAIKPTPSISRAQRSVNLKTKENVEIQIKGRHDACIVPRAVPVVEGIAALAIFDSI